MAREKAGFRDLLERLDERFPDKEALSARELADFIGCDVRTVRKNFTCNMLKKYMKTDVARQISV